MAKNLIWTTLNMIFSIFGFFLHPQIPEFQIVAFQQILSYPNKHQWKDFFQLLDARCYYTFDINIHFKKWTLMTGLVVQGHI